MSGVGQVTFMNQRSFAAPPGQEAFTTEGTFSWVAPAGVTKVSTVVVGSGKIANGATGGALSYKNNISVSPGTSYTVFVSTTSCTRSYFINSCTVSAGGGSARTGDGGGNGGAGAGGYSGNGGQAGDCSTSGTAGSGGGGGGGGFGYTPFVASWRGAGGGVGLLGQGSNGAGGFSGGVCATAFGGGGGSGGGDGGNSTASVAGSGGLFGGGPGFCPCLGNGTGGRSAVRIIWPGCARSFPSTRTGNE